MTPAPKTYKRSFPADDSEVGPVVAEVLEYLRSFYATAYDNTFVTELIIREAVTNAIHHGCSHAGEVSLEIIPAKESFCVRIFDTGPVFSLEPQQPTGELKEHGRGLWILHQYVKNIRLSNKPKYLEFFLNIKHTN